jgi:hypothetical protein
VKLLFLLLATMLLLQAKQPTQEVSVNPKTKRIDSVVIHDSTMEQAQEMIRTAMNDLRKYDRSKIKSTIIIQGDNRSYSEPFYNLIRETVISELNRLKDIRINFVARLPRVIIKGTPTKLSIARTNEKDIEKIALKSDANSIFIWNLFEYNGEMNFIARIINTESKAIMWHYKVNKEYIKNDKLLQAEIIKYKVDDNYYIAAGVSTFFNFSPYTRSGTTDLTANWFIGTDILYSTQSSVDPKLRLGVGGGYIGSFEPELPFSIYNLYVDVRYQLNEFIPPLYESGTGEILQRRNHQSFMIGATFGRTTAIGDTSSNAGNMSIYLNLGISRLFEINLGVQSYLDGTLNYNTNAAYTADTVDLGLFNMFFNVKYKFNYGEEK